MFPRSWPVVLIAAALVGCGKPPVVGPVAPTVREVENPWAKAASALRKETDAGTCRRVLADLSTAATTAGGAILTATTDADRKTVQTALALTDDEAQEIAGAGFTGLDAAHLVECFYLRDAAATLDAGGLPAAAKAERALAWVGRQVQRVPMGTAVPAPPSYTLRRGSGSGLDRAVVFVALCRQLDLDAFLVGPPAANAWTPADPPKGQSPKEPFWAVAVRDGTSLFLFDPVRGVPVPGPTPGKPATLAEAKANPDLLKPWATDGKGPLPTADEVKSSQLFPAVPLSAVSARMATFQQSAGGELGVRAAVDWTAMAKAVEACGAAVGPWAPPQFPFTPARSLREFVPVADGGTADPARSPLLAEFYRRQLPVVTDAPPGTERGLAERYGAVTRGAYARAVIETAPRERLQRGQYDDAAQLLVKVRDEYGALAARAGGDPVRAAAVVEWLAQANDLYKRLSVARLDVGMADGQTAVRQVEAEIQKKWADTKLVETMIADVVAEPVLHEATYLLALTKHEQAERAQLAAGKGAAQAAAAKKAWAGASGWWDRYLPAAPAQEKSFPGRAAHAQALAARAAALK